MRSLPDLFSPFDKPLAGGKWARRVEGHIGNPEYVWSSTVGCRGGVIVGNCRAANYM